MARDDGVAASLRSAKSDPSTHCVGFDDEEELAIEEYQRNRGRALRFYRSKPLVLGTRHGDDWLDATTTSYRPLERRLHHELHPRPLAQPMDAWVQCVNICLGSDGILIYHHPQLDLP